MPPAKAVVISWLDFRTENADRGAVALRQHVTILSRGQITEFLLGDQFVCARKGPGSRDFDDVRVTAVSGGAIDDEASFVIEATECVKQSAKGKRR